MGNVIHVLEEKNSVSFKAQRVVANRAKMYMKITALR